MKNEDVNSKTKYYRLEEKYEHLDVSKKHLRNLHCKFYTIFF